MRNPFKRISNKIKEVTQTAASIALTIEKIHSEFDLASEKLLAEAVQIISRNEGAEKGSRLAALGFTNSAPVSQSKEADVQRMMATKIEYFKSNYPNNKFITDSLVKEICKKYGLLFGNSRSYIGDVPEKNLAEMEAFKLREEDKAIRTNMDDYVDSRRSFMMGIGMGSGGYASQKPPKEITVRAVTPSLMICAPEKDFDMTYMGKVDGYKLQYDPIVLQPVDGGYLIVTKWGLEANDQSLVIPQNN